MTESILFSGPGALADCQVYLAILVALSCPFYVLLGMSAAITLPSNPRVFKGEEWQRGSGPNRWERSVHDPGQSPNTHLCADDKAGLQPGVNGAFTCLAWCWSFNADNKTHPVLRKKLNQRKQESDIFINQH